MYKWIKNLINNHTFEVLSIGLLIMYSMLEWFEIINITWLGVIGATILSVLLSVVIAFAVANRN